MNVAALPSSISSEIVVTLTRKGQVTIPAAVLRLLGLRTESKVSLVLDEESKSVQLQVPRYPTVASLAGAAGTLKHPVPWKVMLDTARADALAKKSSARKHG